MSDQGSTGGGAASAPNAPSTAKPTQVSTPTPANTNGTPPAEEPKFRHKFSNDTEEREYSVSELKKLAEKGIGAEKKFDEAHGLRREVDALLRKLPEDPIGALEVLIGDKSRAAKTVLAKMWRDPSVRAEMEAYLIEQYKYEGLPEDERKRVDEDRDVRRKAAEYERLAKEEEKRKQDAVDQHWQQQFQKALPPALTAAGVDMSDPEEAEEAWDMMLRATETALSQGERPTYDLINKLAVRVKERIDRIATARVRKHAKDPARIAELLGDDGLAAARRHELERHKPKAPMPERTRGNGKAAPDKRNGEQKSFASVMRRIRGEG